MKNESFKEYNENILPFLIDTLKLKKNAMTCNDFFYYIEHKDFKISYNPRCQLLDFTPNSYYIQNNTILPYHYEIMLTNLKNFIDSMCWSFFIKHNKPLDQMICIRLYAVPSNSLSQHPYSQILSENQEEWIQVKNWIEISLSFRKDPDFKYANFGDDYSDNYFSNPVSKEDQKYSKKIKYNLKSFLIPIT